MRFVVELSLDLVTGITGAPTALARLILRQRIATLDHEALDHTVKTGAVVKPLLRQFLKILDVARRNVRPEFEDHLALGGVDDCDFAHGNSMGRKPGACHAKNSCKSPA